VEDGVEILLGIWKRDGSEIYLKMNADLNAN
jgi:hypothetical protein